MPDFKGFISLKIKAKIKESGVHPLSYYSYSIHYPETKVNSINKKGAQPCEASLLCFLILFLLHENELSDGIDTLISVHPVNRALLIVPGHSHEHATVETSGG